MSIYKNSFDSRSCTPSNSMLLRVQSRCRRARREGRCARGPRAARSERAAAQRARARRCGHPYLEQLARAPQAQAARPGIVRFSTRISTPFFTVEMIILVVPIHTVLNIPYEYISSTIGHVQYNTLQYIRNVLLHCTVLGLQDVGRYPLTRKFKTVRRERETNGSEGSTVGTLDENLSRADSSSAAPPDPYEQQEQSTPLVSRTNAQVHNASQAAGPQEQMEQTQGQGSTYDYDPSLPLNPASSALGPVTAGMRHRESSSSSGGTGVGGERPHKEREPRPTSQAVPVTPRPAHSLLTKQVSFAPDMEARGSDVGPDGHPVAPLSTSPSGRGLKVGEVQQRPRAPSPSALRRTHLPAAPLDAIPEGASPTTLAATSSAATRQTDREKAREHSEGSSSAAATQQPQIPPRQVRPKLKLRIETPSIRVTDLSPGAQENGIYSNLSHPDFQLLSQPAPQPASTERSLHSPTTTSPTLHPDSSFATAASSSGEPVYSQVRLTTAPNLQLTRKTASAESTTRPQLQRQPALPGGPHSPQPLARSASQVQPAFAEARGQDYQTKPKLKSNPKARNQQPERVEYEDEEEETSASGSEISDSESAVGTTDNESVVTRSKKDSKKSSAAEHFVHNTGTALKNLRCSIHFSLLIS